MVKLPPSLYDDFRQYKTETKRLINWIVHTAEALGCDVNETVRMNEPVAPKVGTKKDRRKSKSGTTPPSSSVQTTSSECTITVERLLSLTTEISLRGPRQSPPLTVPTFVIDVAKSAIRIRTACMEWFVESGEGKGRDREAKAMRTADVGHWKFIQVLKQIVNLLQPIRQHGSNIGGKNNDVAGRQGTAESVASENPYTVLDADDLPDDDQDMDELPPATETTPPPVSKPSVDYRIQEDDTLMLQLYSVIQDMNIIRKYLQNLWKQYKVQEVDLITASLVTSTAFDIVRTMQEELRLSKASLKDWRSIAMESACYQSVENMIVSLLREDPFSSELAKALFVSVYKTVNSFKDDVSLRPPMANCPDPEIYQRPPPFHTPPTSEEDEDDQMDVLFQQLMTDFVLLSR
ncbi:hypothetical protein HDV00_008271 [Rhizophlyctis rosea]|nr:hypothetical protein HDV00_008271 [Rhizophlyctis rosea]